MHFLCDEMSGSLARWLRMMGHDTLYIKDESDDRIIEIATKEGRFILTRDKDMHRRYPYSLYINENGLEEQLRTVIKELGLKAETDECRCTVCNAPLRRVGKDVVARKVPCFTYLNHDEFFLCPDCGKVFWKGTHWQRIDDFLHRIGATE